MGLARAQVMNRTERPMGCAWQAGKEYKKRSFEICEHKNSWSKGVGGSKTHLICNFLGALTDPRICFELIL